LGDPAVQHRQCWADYLSRLDVAVFGLTANTTEQAIYYSGVLDANDQ
jgi:hypothetical protein